MEALHELHQAQPHLLQRKALPNALAATRAKWQIGCRVLWCKLLMALTGHGRTGQDGVGSAAHSVSARLMDLTPMHVKGQC